MDFKQILKNRPLVISAALAIAAVFLVNMYLTSQKQQIAQQIQEESKQVAAVFVAKDAIAAGDAIRSDMVKKVPIPVRFMQPKAANSLEQIEGRIALVPIEKGEYILTTKLMSRGEGANLAQLTPPGKRAVSIVVDSIAGLGGMVRPGDHVDVISVIPSPVGVDAKGQPVMQPVTVTLFQDVLVLAVGGKTQTAEILAENRKKGEEAKAAAPIVSPVVTLALTPEEANIATYLQAQQVSLRLALRAPTDMVTSSQTPTTLETIIKYLNPNYVPPSMENQPKPPTIEIQKGTKTEDVIVGGTNQ